MGQYTQEGRPLAVKMENLGDDDLLLERFTGHEAISELFHFRLEMLAEDERTIDFGKILGHKVRVVLRYDPPRVLGFQPPSELRFFHGIIKRLSQGGYIYGRDKFVRFEAKMAPAMWLLSKRVQSRTFQHKTVPQILHQVLKEEWQLEVVDALDKQKAKFYPRDYCVQYRESDLAFVSRLMEEEGIFYYFRHTSEKHEIVLGNTPQAYDELHHRKPDEKSDGPDKVPYKEDRDEGCVYRWVKHQEVCTGKVTLWDSCFELPGQNLAAERTVTKQVDVGVSRHDLQVSSPQPLEHYDYPGGYAQRFDGVAPGGADRAADLQHIYEDKDRTAAIRMQEEEAAAIRINGASRCRLFGAGRRFQLDGHFNADDAYLLTRVEHRASIRRTYRSGGAQQTSATYANRFLCLPEAVPFRPRRVTAKPIIPGPQTAVVVGMESKSDGAKDRGSFLDKYGRVKVQFPWDREGKHDADSSCWVRVAQTWAGKRWGAFFWPHVGHEVVVVFEEGDPDRPLVVGSVYNAENMPPFELPHGAPFNGIRSCSLGGNPATIFSGFVFHDVEGDEQFILHSRGHVFLNAKKHVVTNVWGHYYINEGEHGLKYEDKAGWCSTREST
jgi:type VI secretion system secreted protein VgrG